MIWILDDEILSLQSFEFFAAGRKPCECRAGYLVCYQIFEWDHSTILWDFRPLYLVRDILEWKL